MAKGFKSGGRDWKPGETGHQLPSDLRRARRLNKVEFERIANKYFYSSKEEIAKAMSEEGVPAIEFAVCKVIVEAAKHGDTKRLSFLLDRLLGKPKESIEISRPKDDVSELGDEDIENELARLSKYESSGD